MSKLRLAFTAEGRIALLGSENTIFSSERSADAPLFVLRMLRDGKFTFADSRAARSVEAVENGFHFSDLPEYPGLTVTAEYAERADTVEWRLKIDNRTDFAVDTADFPCLTLRDSMAARGGEFKIFRPFVEGVEISDVPTRDPALEAPNISRDAQGAYPGYCPVQYIGYYNGSEGLYFAAHDASGIPKILEAFRTDCGVRLSIRTYCQVRPGGEYSYPFPLVTALSGGGWRDCAERYRAFVEANASDLGLPPKISENPDVPEWLADSPVVVIYPPRSVRGTGYYGPNEFFPYINGVKYLAELSEAVGAPVMSLLAYWEGSGPWCPPFNWPPYGGEESFAEYVTEMHRRGWRVGLYGSGLSWTDRSVLSPEFDMTAYRDENGVARTFAVKPDGTADVTNMSQIREGAHMCVGCEQTRAFARDQIVAMAEAGVDFTQYFDQDHGGLSWPCWSAEHSHPAGYGKWAVDDMRKLYREIKDSLDGRKLSCVIGTEQSPGDVFAASLLLNDRRSKTAYYSGVPVPAYEYVFHEYTMSFLGNLNGCDSLFPVEKNPELWKYMVTEGFVSGCLLAATIKGGGELHWEWGMSWLKPGPDRAESLKLLKNLSAMRRGVGKPWLVYGRMLAPLGYEVSGGPLTLLRANGDTLEVPYVLSTRWRAPDGGEAQLFANASSESRMVTLDFAPNSVLAGDGAPLPVSGNVFELPPLSAALVR